MKTFSCFGLNKLQCNFNFVSAGRSNQDECASFFCLLGRINLMVPMLSLESADDGSAKASGESRSRRTRDAAAER